MSRVSKREWNLGAARAYAATAHASGGPITRAEWFVRYANAAMDHIAKVESALALAQAREAELLVLVERARSFVQDRSDHFIDGVAERLRADIRAALASDGSRAAEVIARLGEFVAAAKEADINRCASDSDRTDAYEEGAKKVLLEAWSKWKEART
jgi:hypothetical protein